MPRITPSSIDLSQSDIDWLAVVCNLNEQSQRAFIGATIRGHLARWRKKHIVEIQQVANHHDLEWEQAYCLLSERKAPYKPEDIKWAKTIKPDAYLLTKEDAIETARPLEGTDSYDTNK
jgi:hypothetical protein